MPYDNADEAAVVEGLDVYPVSNLRQAADFVAGRITLAPYQVNPEKIFESHLVYEEDFADVKGQEHAKRAGRKKRRNGGAPCEIIHRCLAVGVNAGRTSGSGLHGLVC